MKKLLCVCLICMIISCEKEIQPAKINVSAMDTEFMIVRSPIDDIILWNNRADTIYANEANEFVFEKHIEQPEFVTVIIGKERLKSILVPEKTIKINATGKTPIFTGETKAGQQFLNDLKRTYFTVTEANKYRNDSTSVQITTKINVLKKTELDSLQALQEAKKIDADFAKILQKEIEYFYAQRTAEVISSKQYSQEFIPKELMTLFEETTAKYPLKTEYKPASWNMYAEIILQEKAMYDEMASGTISKDSIQQYYLQDKLHPLYYKLISDYEDAEIAEKAAANFIINKTKQNKFEKSLIGIYEQFQKDFPKSVYTKYLTADIEKIKAYHVKISGTMPANVHFYENETIASLSEMLPDLKGEKYYVDVWATWCGPCKAEFKYNEPLNAFLKEKGYKKLYISLDREAQRKKWKQDIKYFDLNGLHLLASQEFFADFEKKHSLQDGYVSIPQYLIIDDGTIVTNNAPRPSELEKLKALLNK
ncbi:thiol-disulfide oxidoreductase [Kordia sp. SMS9]|uniref:TlpA family protein disulfide reductase n=1 Tax=Kordia sp. SMS9 TaxID=2282170 RepID=UPI000E0DBF87|nr:TlpA disulfide reductase family protein [Kordia sp. SMS9]AXG69671.1 thiol-disulfide oxidoreductase [Kordia sp. SMS9]